MYMSNQIFEIEFSQMYRLICEIHEISPVEIGTCMVVIQSIVDSFSPSNSVHL